MIKDRRMILADEILEVIECSVDEGMFELSEKEWNKIQRIVKRTLTSGIEHYYGVELKK